MSAMSGVRYEMALRESEGARAVYACAVVTAARTDTLTVVIEGATSRAEGSPEGVDPAHLAQLLAIAKTVGKHAAESSWPRNVNRWRSPGVR